MYKADLFDKFFRKKKIEFALDGWEETLIDRIVSMGVIVGERIDGENFVLSLAIGSKSPAIKGLTVSKIVQLYIKQCEKLYYLDDNDKIKEISPDEAIKVFMKHAKKKNAYYFA